MVCPLSPSLVSYSLQFKNNLLFRICSRFALTWFLLPAFPLTLFLQPLSFSPAKGFVHLGYLLHSGTLLTIFSALCLTSIFFFLFSPDFEWRTLSKTGYSQLVQRGLTLWREWYQTAAPFLLHFLDVNVLLCRYRGSIACMCFLHVKNSSKIFKQIFYLVVNCFKGNILQANLIM